MDKQRNLANRAGRKLKRLLRRLVTGQSSGPRPRRPRKRDMWSIAIYEGPSPLALKPVSGASDPVLTGRDVDDVQGIYVADPFMLRSGEGWNMFFEVLNGENQLGQIGLASSQDGLSWNYEQIVLREPFHLSYPYVFSWQDEYFMLPETYQANAIRLYRAVGYPREWQFVATLIDGIEAVDASPFHHDGTWWMYVGLGTPPFRAQTLSLFQADELMGPWKEHPASPIIANDGHIARPGGRVTVIDGKIHRFTQDCDPNYGTRVRAFEVTELTPTTYRERPAGQGSVLEPTGSGWNAQGMHHIDPHQIEPGRWRACVDGWFWEELSQ